MEYPIYENFLSVSGGEYIKRINAKDSITFIPEDPGNADYQLYLAWLEETN